MTGITFVTFDSTSGLNGEATPRIFVGVASVGKPNVYVSNDAGSSCKLSDSVDHDTCQMSLSGEPIQGTNTSWMAHKGVLSPQEGVLYLSTSDGVGKIAASQYQVANAE